MTGRAAGVCSTACMRVCVYGACGVCVLRVVRGRPTRRDAGPWIFGRRR